MKVTGKLDSYIIPILQHLWKKGVETLFSCAGHKEDDYFTCYLAFKHNPFFMNYLWDNGFAIRRKPCVTDSCFYMYIVEPNDYDSIIGLSKDFQKKLLRDRFLMILSRYEKKT